MRPLIAVTTSEMRVQNSDGLTRHDEPPQEEMALGLKYLRAIEQAGGIPVVVPPLDLDAIEPLLAGVAGVCLSGGPDLDPVAYGARRHELTGPSWESLDRCELALARSADERRLPVLAICRGLQVLNVARGGTLHQHLPDVVGDRIAHRQTEAGSRPTHWVSMAAGGRLPGILGSRRRMVNSFHHQAIAELGDGLRPAAWASDGTIEAVEAVDREFVIGVQWHAECLVARYEHAALFDAFVQASRCFAAARTRFAVAA
ncbi:MAG: gamma-glutamyl-gamma-aminobutyrate hydrolase family protein [Solirubrobacteraceae bacterium]